MTSSRNLTVTFHGIGAPPIPIPDDERPFWAPPEQFSELVPQVLSIARTYGLEPLFTFDDGNLSDLEIAVPILLRHKAQAIFFPCSGRIGQPGYLTAENIRTMVAHGFGIGSHGIAHVPWAKLDRQGLKDEVNQSKAVLQEVSGQQVISAALPFGSYRRAVLQALRKAGYRTVYSSDPGLSPAGRWFNYRFSYRNDRPFLPEQLITNASGPLTRIRRQVKTSLKSLR